MSEANDVDRVVINRYPNGFDCLTDDGDVFSMRALKLAYRKHVTNDDGIGWDELCDVLGNALAQTMGDDAFCEWLKGL